MKSQEIVAQKDEEQKSVDESKQVLTGNYMTLKKNLSVRFPTS